jgi:hypothetical protein
MLMIRVAELKLEKKTKETRKQKTEMSKDPALRLLLCASGRNLVSLSSWKKVRVRKVFARSHMFNPSRAPLMTALCSKMLETDILEKVQVWNFVRVVCDQ